MAAFQLAIKGHGNVPDEAVASLRHRVMALVEEAAVVGVALRVDFAPAVDPVSVAESTGAVSSRDLVVEEVPTPDPAPEPFPSPDPPAEEDL